MHAVPPPDADTFVRRVSNDQFWLQSDEDGVYLVHTTTGERARIVAPNSHANGAENGRFALIPTLSARELEVFSLLGDGFEMSDIAARLDVSVKTVETYRARMKQKLEIKNRANLLRLAVEWTLHGRPRMPGPTSRESGNGQADHEVPPSKNGST